MMEEAIICTLGTKGDLLPYLAIGRELRAKGIKVLVLSSEPYRALCEFLGFEFQSIQSTEELNRILSHPQAWSPWLGPKFYIENISVALARPMFESIGARVQRGPACIVTNNMCAGAFLAAEKFDLPLISVALQPYAYWSRTNPARMTPWLETLLRSSSGRGRPRLLDLVEWHVERLFKPLETYRRELGLAARGDFFSVQRHASKLNLALWPEWFCPPVEDWPANSQRTGFAEIETESKWMVDPSLQDVLAHRPIVFTMGSEMIQDFESNAKLFSEVCRDLKRRGILVSPKIRGQGGLQWSESLIVLEAAPFQSLFPQASVVVSHGGVGTLAKAFRAGRPNVVLPMAHDQFDNGFHVQRLKVGFSSPRKGMKRKHLAGLIERALHENEVREASERLAQKISEERGASTAAHLIQQVTA